MFFQSIVQTFYGTTKTSGWIIFGCAVGLLLSHAIIEAIYELDIKAVFSNKRQIVIPALFVSMIVCIFQFDLFGFDTIPKKEKIESADVILDQSVWMGGIDFRRGTAEDARIFYQQSSHREGSSGNLDLEILYPLLEAGIKNEFPSKENFGFSVEYQLKSGRKIRRSYNIDGEQYKENINALFDSKEMKESMYRIYYYSDEELSKMKLFYSRQDSKDKSYYQESNKIRILMAEKERNELMRIYQEELYQLKYNDAGEDKAIGCFYFGDGDKQFPSMIYPGFEKTLKMIEPYIAGME